MKASQYCWKNGLQLVFCLMVVLFDAKLFAQTAASNTIPVVTLEATTPVATSTNAGVFTVFRAGNTNLTLNVYYQISGTASNGGDYKQISNWVLIPAGTTSGTIAIDPIEGAATGGTAKTVILQLAPSPLMIPINYEIGVPNNAVVYVENDGETNLPPAVSILEPTDGSVFYTPTNIEIIARATDLDGSVTNVEFFAGTNDLGSGNPVVLDPPGVNGITGLVYFFNWTNVPAGSYALTAAATDNSGISTVSAAVNVTVIPPVSPPQPMVRIVSPANGQTFWSPVNIPLYANVQYVADAEVGVQFLDGTNRLGMGQPVMLAEPLAADSGSNGTVQGGPVPPIIPENLYYLVWTNAPVGEHVLTAEAFYAYSNHDLVLISYSLPVNITVLPSPPPPTNFPALVDIVATDPVAIEGTNGWNWAGETNATPTWAAWPTATLRWFTNYGPKTATFTVRRWGSTNDDLTVFYNIGGTASNGVDYVTISNYTTISAGERRAMITIAPIDDGPPDVNKTVVLSLTPSTNTPPDYRVGWPARAAVVIVDGNGRHPITGPLPGGCFHLSIPGPDAAWYCLEYSTNLANWTPVCTNQVVNGSIDFVDPDAQANPSKYYRAVPLTNPPAD